jgi:hypothetical protein
MNHDKAKRELMMGLLWGGSMVALALAMVFARKLGYVDQDTVLRVVIGSNGLMIAWYGNRLPKTFIANARAREARRVSAWAQVLSGLAYAGLWAFAPIPVAVAGGIAVVLAGFLVTIGYCMSLRGKAKGTA